MARIRTIKPEYWTDDAVTECSVSARLMFIGIWNFADDAGNLDRSSKQIKARVFPTDSIDCEPLVQELIAHGLLIEYSVSGKNYLHIPGFTDHQVINRPSKPQCPPYEKSLKTQTALTGHSVSTHDGREGKGKEVTTSSVPDESEAFKAFWQIWPKSQRKVAKGECWKLWRKNKFDSVAEQILANVEAMKKTEQWRTGYDPMPEVYLRNRRWEGAELPSVQAQQGTVW